MASLDLAREAIPAGGARALRVRPPSRALVAGGECLSRFATPTVRLAGRRWPAYGFCVSSGVVAGAGWAVALAASTGWSPLVALALMLAGLATALALAFATKAVTGNERFTFYHYQLAVLGAGGALLVALGLPVLAGLDLFAVALAVTLAVGRVGCLSAGCCHGRPARWGVRYREEHAATGFPGDLVGVGLWPVALVESAGAALLAASSSVLVLSGHAAPGTAVALSLGGYAILRFLLERLRGDRRPRLAGLSEAQWTALVVLASVAALGAAGPLSMSERSAAAAGVALAALVVVAFVDVRRQRGGLLAGAHATEVAGQLVALARAASGSGHGPIEVRTTSRRLRLSTGVLGSSHLVSFSLDGTLLSAPLAESLGRRLLAWSEAGFEGELVQGGHGVWHLLVAAEPARRDG